MNPFTDLIRLSSYLNAKFTYQPKIAGLFGVAPAQVRGLYKEVLTSGFIADVAAKRGLRPGFFDFSMLCVLRAPTLYVICRILKPEAVVETGVADGFSSSFILKAMEVNNQGHLYSIDLPNQAGHEIRQDKTTGWIIPDKLRTRWDLILGASSEELSPLLRKLNKIDMFYHDSDHSYENMEFEFNAAYQHLNKNGILISDDITDNSAFDEFFSRNCLRHIKLFKLGVIRV